MRVRVRGGSYHAINGIITIRMLGTDDAGDIL